MIRRPSLRRVGAALLALAAGAAFPLGLAPFDWWPVTLAAVAALFWLLCRGHPRPLLLGWLFGAGKYGAGASWIYVSIHVYGDAPPLLAGFLVAVFVAGMALFHAGAAWVFVRLRPPGAVAAAVAFAAVWVLTEWLLTWFLTGFPWLFAGYAMLDTPLAALAPVGGVLLVGFGAVLTAACLVRWRSRAALVVAALPWLASWSVAGVEWTTPGERYSVALVQGNIDQATKWDEASRADILERYASLSGPVWNRDIVIWPEAAITLPLHMAGSFLTDMAERAEGALVLGILFGEWSPDGARWYNGAVAVGDGDGRYAKRRLVPFGDYVPLQSVLRGLIGFFDLPMSRTVPGDFEQPLLRAGSAALAMSVCYEIAYPELVRASAGEADALVTISNDTWFGASIGPRQHLQIARMRALENGRYVLRATNNGVTAIVDAYGRVVDELPQFERGVLTGEAARMAGTTPFGRWGTLAVVGPLALVLVILGAMRLRRSASRAED